MTADEWRTRVDALLRQVLVKMDTIDNKMDQLLYEDDIDTDPRERTYRTDDGFVSENDIITKGQKVPYNRIDNEEDMNEFREFITYVRNHEHEFTQKEFDYAGFADKNFSDVRLSDNSRRVLGTAYAKLHKRQWDFNFVRGNMFKHKGSIAWRWSDGRED